MELMTVELGKEIKNFGPARIVPDDG